MLEYSTLQDFIEVSEL